jgi:MoaA/NifB/PqqE/SkfB family radical SAM enzyme
MKRTIPQWQRDVVRGNMTRYRAALENYYIKDKKILEVDGGYKAFSLLSPPVASPAARRRIRYIMENLITASSGIDTDPLAKRTPHFITIAVTYQCQCDCRHCSASAYQKQVEAQASALTDAELQQAIRECIRLGATSIVLTGGEPLLHPGIYDCIQAVDRTKAICTLFTNGELITSDTAKQLKKAGAFGVFISFDFSDAKRHDAQRGRVGIFERACRAVALCQEAGILTGISTFVTKEKLESGEMDRMMELARSLGVLEVFIFDVIPTGKLRGSHSQLLGEKEFSMIRSFRERYNTQPSYPRIIHQTMLTSIAYPCTKEGCPAGIAHMHLRANGDVSPCDFTPLSFGNIRSRTLDDIWQRITTSEAYSKPSHCCRLSDPRIWDSGEEFLTLDDLSAISPR